MLCMLKNGKIPIQKHANKALYFGSVDYNSNSQLIKLLFMLFKRNIQMHINPDTRLIILYVIQNDINKGCDQRIAPVTNMYI